MRLAAALLVGTFALLFGSASDAISQRSTTVWAHIFKIGSDGEITQSDRVFLRQLGMDKIAIAQIIKQTKDGGRLTRAEVITIANGFILRKNPQCRRTPLTPSCKALFATAKNFD